MFIDSELLYMFNRNSFNKSTWLTIFITFMETATCAIMNCPPISIIELITDCTQYIGSLFKTMEQVR